MKVRLNYNKLYPLSLISHLDVQKTFQRAFRRAGIDLVHSSGFHPHPKISYAPPLPLFASSLDEIMDVLLVCAIGKDELKERLNAALPEKMQITKVNILSDDDLLLSHILKAAKYKITFTDMNVNDFAQKINSFLKDSKNIIVEKKSKKGLSKTDIKPYISDFSLNEEGRDLILSILLPLSCEKIISPNLLIKAINENVFANNDIYTQILKEETIIA